MKNKTGKLLENFVQKIEALYKEDNVTISVNDKVIVDGVVYAEFDIIVKGSFGSTTVNWLIECRDRPSTGKQGTSWVEQLAGRRTLHNFDRVTAVSTTGFSDPAINAAEKLGIELREIQQTKEDNIDWLPRIKANIIYEHVVLNKAKVKVSTNTKSEHTVKLLEFFRDKELNCPMLVNSNSSERSSLKKQYLSSFRGHADYEKIWQELTPNGPKVSIVTNVKPNDDFEYYLKIDNNTNTIIEMDFEGEVSKIHLQQLFLEAFTYRIIKNNSGVAKQVTRIIKIPNGPEFKVQYTETNNKSEFSIHPPEY